MESLQRSSGAALERAHAMSLSSARGARRAAFADVGLSPARVFATPSVGIHRDVRLDDLDATRPDLRDSIGAGAAGRARDPRDEWLPLRPDEMPEHPHELWWAQTDYYSEFRGIHVALDQGGDSDGYVHVWGVASYGGDPLIQGSLGWTEYHVLSPDRFPTAASSRFEIPTKLLFGGGVLGCSLGTYHPIWNADDKWCKCWITTRQSVFASAGGIDPIMIPVERTSLPFVLGDQQQSVQLLDYENATLAAMYSPITFRDMTSYPYPIRFDAPLAVLAAAGISLVLRTEVRFDIQLEGESAIYFTGSLGAQPRYSSALRCRSPRLHLAPL
ncbi:hypothetical protein L6R52_00655 [Myxococcota bacterium]|nr:hypothetical protein [Myxococcota bacterium]